MRLVLPAFTDAIPAMRWGILIPFLSSFTPVNLMFHMARRQDLYVVAIILGMLTYGGCLLWLVRGGVTLVAFPQAMLVGQVVSMLFSCLFVLYLIRKERAPHHERAPTFPRSAPRYRGPAFAAAVSRRTRRAYAGQHLRPII